MTKGGMVKGRRIKRHRGQHVDLRMNTLFDCNSPIWNVRFVPLQETSQKATADINTTTLTDL